MPDRVMPNLTHACVVSEPPAPLSPSAPGRRASLSADHISIRLAKLPSLMRVTDLVGETGLSTATIQRKLDSGELRSVRPSPGTRAVPSEWFVEWLEQVKAAAIAVTQ